LGKEFPVTSSTGFPRNSCEVNVALVTGLAVNPEALAMQLIVSLTGVPVSVNPVAAGLLVVGVVPSVVQLNVAPAVVSVIETESVP
jgi:hypothetical protein